MLHDLTCLLIIPINSIDMFLVMTVATNIMGLILPLIALKHIGMDLEGRSGKLKGKRVILEGS